VKTVEGLHTIADGGSAVDANGLVHYRLSRCMVTRWSFYT
jgi:hypothetical protein